MKAKTDTPQVDIPFSWIIRLSYHQAVFTRNSYILYTHNLLPISTLCLKNCDTIMPATYV